MKEKKEKKKKREDGCSGNDEGKGDDDDGDGDNNEGRKDDKDQSKNQEDQRNSSQEDLSRAMGLDDLLKSDSAFSFENDSTVLDDDFVREDMTDAEDVFDTNVPTSPTYVGTQGKAITNIGSDIFVKGNSPPHVEVSAEHVAEPTKATSSSAKESWLETLPLREVHYFTSSDALAKKNDRSPILSWMYDSEKHLYLVKRKNGRIEYFANMHDFESLPGYDLRALNKAPFYNLGNNGHARNFASFLDRECVSDFKIMKTAKCKRANPMTGFLDIHCTDREFTVADPMDLLKFGKEDMLRLSKQRFFMPEENEKDTKPFIKVLATTLVKGLYTGGGDHSADVEIL
ncbi:hypothetical protein L1987_64458 [Smallanthus sonchifolius]|uniref:Uncharacterized protein n=1 Tax=Smallanthus sonchifolius TaxID=185202 RepID=A0ACB9CG15_9ASTR|nr:hypothetical protein L1987_64458 [Smallanthus sonchifolius]